jgi:transcriptional regulator with XRE-family HTH domain
MAGLPADGTARRVPGLRREEVAVLAGVSVDYYTRLERGKLHGVSDNVLNALASTLQLDDAERDHLFDLARAANSPLYARRPAHRSEGIRPHLQRLIDALDVPTVVRNGYFDYVAANRTGRALFSPLFEDPKPNSARFVFLNDTARDFYIPWRDSAEELVDVLRAEVGRNPFDKKLSDLVGQLATRSDDFRRMWAKHDVRHHQSGLKRLHHPEVGDLELIFEAVSFPADPGLAISTYAAQPGSPSADVLTMLASWTALTSPTTTEQETSQ